MLEAQISTRQHQLKKMKTEVSAHLTGKLCDEEDYLFAEVENKDEGTAEVLNLNNSETKNTQEHVAVEDVEVKS